MGPVNVVNIALTEIGAKATVSSINPSDGSNEANIASTLYQPKMDALMRSAHWNCCRKQLALTLLKAVVIDGVASDDPPPQPWLYEYAYPSDCLKARYIMPIRTIAAEGVPLTTYDNMVPVLYAGSAVRYAVATDTVNGNVRRVILTNMPQAILVYTARIDNPDLWDPHFLNAATSSLGAWMVTPLSMKQALIKTQIAIAQSIIAEARVSDGNEGLTSADHYPDWMRIRGIGGPFPDGSFAWTGWDAIGWPDGSVF